MKRSANEMSPGQTLEDAVYEYIERWQEVEDGVGVGIACGDLNRNIVHPEKPRGKGSEAQFVTVLRQMPSLIESEEKWNGKVVFQLKSRQPEIVEAKKLLTAVIRDLDRRLNALHPSAARVNICRDTYTTLLEDLIAANELLSTAGSR